jgi:hypothetical protein
VIKRLFGLAKVRYRGRTFPSRNLDYLLSARVVRAGRAPPGLVCLLMAGAYHMVMQRSIGFVLYVNNQTKAIGVALQEAQRLAEPYTREKRPLRLRIESDGATSPWQVWSYDHATRRWVERS